MPLPVIAGTVRASVRGQCPSGQPWVNVHHFQFSAGASYGSSADVTALDVELSRFYSGSAYAGGSPVLGQCRSVTTLIDITYTQLDGLSISRVIAHAANGTNASSLSSPSEASLVLTLRTNKRGRRYRGRIYLPPMVADLQQGLGEIAGATATGFVNNYAGMTAALAPKNWVPVVASYGYYKKEDGTVVTWTPHAEPVTNPTMDLKYDVQRRRK